MEINGIILINKARGESSNHVVGEVKKILKASKAGHLGTLDVLGEGLLPVTLGKATKLFDYFLTKDKVYKTRFKFGVTSATLDMEGEITERNDVVVSLENLQEAAKHFVGKYLQMPPAYSAKKIKGQKAYDLARAGKEVQLTPKEIEIYSIKILKQVDINEFELEVWCSSGTYIRSLCRDMATRLGTSGIMSNIQRTRCGKFSLDDSVTLDELKEGKINLLDLNDVIDYPEIAVDDETATKLLNGVRIKKEGKYSSEGQECYDEGQSCYKGGYYKVTNRSALLGIGKIEDNVLKLQTRLI